MLLLLLYWDHLMVKDVLDASVHLYLASDIVVSAKPGKVVDSNICAMMFGLLQRGLCLLAFCPYTSPSSHAFVLYPQGRLSFGSI